MTDDTADDTDLRRLQAENAELRLRLQEFEDMLHSIRRGDVDALIVNDEIFTLESANDTTQRLRKDVLAQMADAVFAFDLQGHAIFVNAAAERRYATSASSALGRHRDELFMQSELPSEFAALPGAVPVSSAAQAVCEHTLADGTSFHVEVVTSTLIDAQGDAIGSLAVMRDVSDRLRAERLIAQAGVELAKRERQFATLVENSPDIFARMDRELRHLYASPVVERYSGIPAAAHIGRTNAELGMPPALCSQWEAATHEVFRSGKVSVIKFEFTGIDGRSAIFEARLIPEFSDNGAIESVLSIASDITEREAMDAALRRADRQKDEFLATLAHELRNPLAPISNALQIMRLSRDPVSHENARLIVERQLKQMVHLVDDLLDVSRISQGKVELRREPLDMVDIVNLSIETSRPLIDGGKHRLTVGLPPPGSLRVHGDSTRLCQVLSNLLNNAAKYTPVGGTIEIAAERSGGDAVVTVRDTGIGISPEMLPRVFDMFAQVEHTLPRAQGGLGIGLALVRTLTGMHGGSVQAHSDGLGRGSCFTVRLPLIEGHATAHHGDVPDMQAGRSAVRRVLIVDDNVDSAQTLADILRMMGYQSFVAHDGFEAVRLAEACRPHVAVLDIGLPILNGHEVAQRIRAQPGGDRVLLIAVSGWGQAQDLRRSRDNGFDHHFVKPAELQALTALIARGERRGQGQAFSG